MSNSNDGNNNSKRGGSNNNGRSDSKTVRSFVINGQSSSLAYAQAINVAKTEDRIINMTMSSLPGVRRKAMELQLAVNAALMELEDKLTSIRSDINRASKGNGRGGNTSKKAKSVPLKAANS